MHKSSQPGIHITKIEGQDLPLATKKNVAGVAAEALLEKYPTDHGFEIEIYKGIKAGSGIGSSAASAAGAVLAFNALLGEPFSRNQLIEFAMKGEKNSPVVQHTLTMFLQLFRRIYPSRCGKTPDVYFTSHS